MRLIVQRVDFFLWVPAKKNLKIAENFFGNVLDQNKTFSKKKFFSKFFFKKTCHKGGSSKKLKKNFEIFLLKKSSLQSFGSKTLPKIFSAILNFFFAGPP